ncbi:MAG TPA: hypothetical protein VFL95_09855 [Gemmatimonadales bacterium]|nr:hypothetical protein [Gemmatimonadales bacterium]
MLPQLVALVLTIGVIATLLGAGGYLVCRAAIRRALVRYDHDDQASRQLLQDLGSELIELRREVAELTERVDFAERMLTQGGPGGMVPRDR